MHPDLTRLIELQSVDADISRLNGEIAALPKRVAAIETKLNSARQNVEKAAGALKSGDAEKRRLESDIQTEQSKISKYKDQSLNVKTNDEYRALLSEIKFAEQAIEKLEEKIIGIMVQADVLRAEQKDAETDLKSRTAEIEREKDQARQVTAKDEAELARAKARRDELRAGIAEDTLAHYDRVLKFRGTGLASVTGGMCMGCRVMLRPQVMQKARLNEEIIACDQCQRILWVEDVVEAPRSSDDQPQSA